MSVTARDFIDNAARAGHDIVLSPISLAEIIYLIEKGRLAGSAYRDLMQALQDPAYVISEASFTGDIVEAMTKVSRQDIPDLPDGIVAATAVYFDVPVISRDGRIRTSAIQSIW